MQACGLIVIFYPQFHGVHGIARYLASLLAHARFEPATTATGEHRGSPALNAPPSRLLRTADAPPDVVLITAKGKDPAPRYPDVEVIELPVPDNRLGLLQWGWQARQVLRGLEARGPIEAVNLHIPPLLPALFLPRRWPIVLTAHTTYLGMSGRFESNAHFASPWNRMAVALKMRLERWILARATRVITLTEQGRQELARYGRTDHVEVIPNGVDVQAFQPAPPEAQKAFDVLFCGRIEQRKGSRPMVEVCRRLVEADPAVRIGIVGVGDDDRHVRAALTPLAPQVTLLGRRALHEMPDLYRCGRVYASTSYYEGLPGTALEAMACGLPAVVWDRAFYDALVIDGVTGRRVAVNDIGAMVGRLQDLLHDREGLIRMGQQARDQVCRHHAWSSLGPRVLEACRQPQGPTAARPLRVHWAGLRGLPGVQGGVEAHAEQLCPRLQALGCEVTVFARRPHLPQGHSSLWRGVQLRPLWAPRHPSLEALVHTGLAVLHAAFVRRPDVLHLHAIGPALWTPLARALGLRVVVTHHGPDYERQKWGWLARAALRRGEAAAARWAHGLIAIARGIQKDLARRHMRHSVLIPNGMADAASIPSPSLIQGFGLQPQRYVLLVSRLVPEKRHLDLIQAFARARPSDQWRLVLTGAADHGDAYARSVRQAARGARGVVMTGFQTGPTLSALYAHCALFVLPSSHEGLPIALLEALAWDRPVLASDIEAHRELGLSASQRFPLGDVDTLADQLRAWTAHVDRTGGVGIDPPADLGEDPEVLTAARLRQRFDWDLIARQTLQVYETVSADRGAGIGRIDTSWKARS